MIDTFVIFAGIALVCYGIYKWGISNNDYFAKRNLKYVPPYFLFGNFGGVFLGKYSINEFVQSLYNSFPTEKIIGAFQFKMPLYVLRDPEVIKQILVKDFDHFQDHMPFLNAKTDVLFGNSLFLLTGEKWRDMRATLSPAFTGSKMRQMFDLVNDCAFQMTSHIKTDANTGHLQDHEMKELFSRYANDVIASTAFGITVNSFENQKNEFYTTGKILVDFSSVSALIKMLSNQAMPRLMEALDISVVNAKASKYFKSLVLGAMDYRKKNDIFRPDMINIMMKLKAGSTDVGAKVDATENEESGTGFATVEESSIGKVEVKRQWTDTELVAQCFLFFLAGFDTSSTTLSFTAHELAINTEIQDKLYAEIVDTNSKLNGAKLTYDELQKMKFMDMVVTESLRYWPPFPTLNRICVKDYEYNDGHMNFKVENGTLIWVPVYGLHHDPQYFPNPNKFDPERFSEENKANIVPGTYLPFGVGPRNCIGSRFALIEVKAILFYMLLNFKIEPNTKTQIPLQLKKNAAAVIPEIGIHLRMTPR